MSATVHRMPTPPAAVPEAEPEAPPQAWVRVPHAVRLISGQIVRAGRYLATWHPDGRVTIPVKHFALSDEIKNHPAAEAWQWPKARRGETAHIYLQPGQFELEAAESIPDIPTL